jgi:capsular polysaccharide biosynthesis protein
MDPMRNRNPRIIESGRNVPVETSDDAEYGFSVQDLLRIVRQWFWVIAVTMVVITGMVVGFSVLQTPVYEASIKVIVGQKRASDPTVGLGGEVQGLQQLTQTMAEAISTRPIAQAVIRELNLRESPEDLLENLSVETTSTTQFIEVSYKDTSPEQAKRIVNAVGDRFSEQVSDVSPTANIRATVWERAATPDTPVSPDPIRDGLLALVVGSMLGVGLVFLLDYLDDSWQSPEEVEQISGVPTLGVIPVFEVPKVKKGDG